MPYKNKADHKKSCDRYYRRNGMTPCQCGCGTLCVSQFAHGHYARTHKAPAWMRLRKEYKGNKNAKTLGFTLTDDEFVALTSGVCHYCGARPSKICKYNTPWYAWNGIDRIDSTKGYHAGNCVSCCSPCNRAKGSMPYEEFMEWLTRLTAYRGVL